MEEKNPNNEEKKITLHTEKKYSQKLNKAFCDNYDAEEWETFHNWIKENLDFNILKDLETTQALLKRKNFLFQKKHGQLYNELMEKIDGEILDLRSKELIGSLEDYNIPFDIFHGSKGSPGIFKGLDPKTLRSCKRTCMSWCQAVEKTEREALVFKVPTDQQLEKYNSGSVTKLKFIWKIEGTLNKNYFIKILNKFKNIIFISPNFDNSYLKILDNGIKSEFSTLFMTSMKNLNFLKKLPMLTSIDIDSCSKISDLRALENLTNLKSITFMNCTEITSLSPIKNLVNLREIDVHHCDGITDMQSIENLTNLRSLSFNTTDKGDISPDKSDYLRKLLSLESITFSRSEGTHIGFLRNLGALTRLSLLNCFNLNDQSLEDIKGLTNLKMLSLFSCCKITSLNNLDQFVNLRFLDATCCSNLVSIKGIEKLTKLTYLNFYGCKSIPSEEFKILENLINMRELNLYRCFNITSLEPLKNLTQLTDLNIESCTHIAQDEYKYLKNLINLEKFIITDNDKFTANELKYLEESRKLNSVKIRLRRNITKEEIGSFRKKLQNPDLMIG